MNHLSKAPGNGRAAQLGRGDTGWGRMVVNAERVAGWRCQAVTGTNDTGWG